MISADSGSWVPSLMTKPSMVFETWSCRRAYRLSSWAAPSSPSSASVTCCTSCAKILGCYRIRGFDHVASISRNASIRSGVQALVTTSTCAREMSPCANAAASSGNCVQLAGEFQVLMRGRVGHPACVAERGGAGEVAVGAPLP